MSAGLGITRMSLTGKLSLMTSRTMFMSLIAFEVPGNGLSIESKYSFGVQSLPLMSLHYSAKSRTSIVKFGKTFAYYLGST